MYCSTCGARAPAGRRECATCGARLALPPQPGARPEPRAGSPPGVPRCPRCGYRGQGLPYFTRGAHVAGLVGATVLTAGALGAGGIIYYVVRKDHVICPRCGAGWGREAERAVVHTPGEADADGHAVAATAPTGREGAMRGFAMLLWLLAAVGLFGGIVGATWQAIVMAAFAAGGAALLQHQASQNREERRRALLSSLQLPVLQLAARSGGRLTVSQTAAELGWTLPRAEKVLASLEDDFRVASVVTDQGVIVYEFRELVGEPDRAISPREAEDLLGPGGEEARASG